MSGAVKAVTKVFKKITKSAVGQFIVAAGVSYFTAGLGASVLGATGLGATLSPTMGTVLSHAISGAVTGGITSALGGGKIGKGLLLGAAGGAVMGGVQSALGNYTTIPGATDVAPTSGTPTGTANTPDPSASAGSTAPGAVGSSATAPVNAAMPPIQNAGYISPPPGVQSAGLMPPGSSLVDTSGWASGTTKAFYNPATGATSNIAGTGKTGLMGFVDRNPALVEGATKGAISMATSGDGGGTDYAAATEARIAADREEQLRIQGSHSGSGGLLAAGSAPQQSGGLLPSQRWNTSDTGYSNGRWVYDPSKAKVVFVPNAPSAA